ncbi:transcriptional regulator [Leuconostoc citreum]|uniref:LCP family glycopolymer transferase n=1 Tax=Leuconostoc citreum TaxID=33964 RepID=UPI000A2011EA|nr:LCP family protein [Leuconostoc citreum]MCT3067126.1 transcriptional regulator [Leuconostoc citreum]OSP82345.1 transcriptional regulator [Leuconostoc citreum]QEA46373.1 transcriptional regulator [Leuconostoc citreum]QEA63063.1 transcriptional regulator [Leuconostoc citreum]TDG65605.1 hypothetical protein C5L21_000808 [Leuconostoc citreum]
MSNENKRSDNLSNQDQTTMSRVEQRQPKKRGKKRIILMILGFLILLGAGFGTYYASSVKSSLDKAYFATGLGSEKEASTLIKEKKPISFLVLGTDTGTDGGFGSGRDRVGLTDSLMLVTVNPQKETTTLVSVPRDIMTSISGFESSFPQKLNAAYAFREASDDKASLGDGVGTTMETIQKMFNIPINYFAMVNMSGLGDVVDQLGGVKAKSPLSFKFSQDTAHEDGNNLYDFTEGKTSFEYAADGENFKKYDKMDGKAALAFSRMRYQDPQGDYGRTQRQRILLQAIMTKIKSDPSTILNTKFISATTKNIASNMKMSDMLALGSNYMNATKTIDSYTVQGEGEMYDGVSYQRVTTAQRQAITNKLRAALELKPEDTGSEFGSTVTESQIAQVGSADTLFSQFNTKSNENLTSN